MLAPNSSLPPFNPLEAGAAYDPMVDHLQALIEPALHAPWRGPGAIIVAWLLALSVTIGAVGLARACGAATPAAWIAAGALLLSAPFAASVRHGADAILSVLLVWVTWWLLIRGASRTWRWHGAAATAWAGATQFSWLAIATLPVILLALVARQTTPRARALAMLGAVALAGGGAAMYLRRMAIRIEAQMADVDLPVTVFDVARVAWGNAGRAGDVRFAAPDVGGTAALWIVLAAAALVFAEWPRWWRAGLALTFASLGMVWLEWMSWRADLLRWAAWMAAPLAAAGLTWVASQSTRRWRGGVTGLLGAALVGASLSAAARPLGGIEPRMFRDRFETALGPILERARVAFVAEDSLIDSAIVAWGIGPRLAQHPDALRKSEGRGFVPVIGPVARAHLELVGVQFATVAAITDPAPYHLSRIAEWLHCAIARTDRWSLLPGLEYTGRVGLEIPPALGGRLVLIVGDEVPLELRAALPNGSAIPLDHEALLSGPGAGAPPPDYWFDEGDPRRAPQQVVRVRIPAHPTAASLVSLYLGRRALRVLTRLEGHDDMARGRVCAAPLGPDAFWRDDPSEVVRLPLGAAPLFGAGWHGVEGTGGDVFRWTGADAAVLIPSAREGPVRVALDAAPAAEPGQGGPTLTLRVNGLAEPPQGVTAGVSRYEWLVPAKRWVTGTNELLFSVSRSVRPADRGGHDTRVLGLRVHGLTVTREGW